MVVNRNRDTLVNGTADIVAAYVSSNIVSAAALPDLIAAVHTTLSTLGKNPQAGELRPASRVTIRSSIKPDYLVCLEDGKRLKMLKRYLMAKYRMTPDDYRRKWGLNSDYPMIAPNYAKQRSDIARLVGLGRKSRKDP